MAREDADAANDAAARRARAIALLAEQLERGEVTDATFRPLIAANPDLEPDLLELRDGLALFRAQRPALRALDHARQRALRRWRWVAAAAAVLAIGVTAWWFAPQARHDHDDGERMATVGDAERSAGVGATQHKETPTDDATQGNVAAVLTDCGVALLEDVVARPDLTDSPLLRVEPDSAQIAAAAAAANGTAGFYSVLHDMAREQPASVGEGLLARLGKVRASLADPRGTPCRKQASAAIDAGQVLDPGRPYLFALRSDPDVAQLLARAPQSLSASETAAQLLAKLRSKAVFRLRAIDLDAGGVERSGARVYARLADLASGELGEPQLLGVTPLARDLDAGDWRLIVVDETSGGPPRHSELRMLAAPGEDLGLQVAFLRATDGVTAQMSEFDACTYLFGLPPTEPQVTTALPQSVCKASRLWIDPCEATCADYSAFYCDVCNHLEWFDGASPLHRPSILEADGHCPPAMSNRAIVGITWKEAVLYANWKGKRLPTEREWERVARGTMSENRKYPWGNEFRAERINDANSITSIAKSLPVSGRRLDVPSYAELPFGDVGAPEYSGGRTPEIAGGPVSRLADNVSEFTEDLYVEASPRGEWRFLDVNTIVRTARGGNWFISDEQQSRTWSRTAVAMSGGMFFGLRGLKTDLSTAIGK